MAISLKDAWDISRIRLPGKSVLGLICKSEDCAKSVHI